MDENGKMVQPGQAGDEPSVIPNRQAQELRKLSHDLSNALEIIVQTSYLLSLAEIKEPATEWLRMLDGGVTRALEINNTMRTYLREHSPK